eukprot:scaffold70714_cov65-Phaeocystis_antarctica.AAC.6
MEPHLGAARFDRGDQLVKWRVANYEHVNPPRRRPGPKRCRNVSRVHRPVPQSELLLSTRCSLRVVLKLSPFKGRCAVAYCNTGVERLRAVGRGKSGSGESEPFVQRWHEITLELVRKEALRRAPVVRRLRLVAVKARVRLEAFPSSQMRRPGRDRLAKVR